MLITIKGEKLGDSLIIEESGQFISISPTQNFPLNKPFYFLLQRFFNTFKIIKGYAAVQS